MTQYLPFGLIVDGRARRVVVPETHARLDEHAVDRVPRDGDGRHVGDRQVVEPAHGRAAESAARRLRQVVVVAGLVVDLRNPAVRVRAERVLRGRVGVPARLAVRARLHDADVARGEVGLAQHLVERAVVGCQQRARRAVRGHAGIAGGGIDVAGALRPGRRRRASRPRLRGHRPCHAAERGQGRRQHEGASEFHGVPREPNGR